MEKFKKILFVLVISFLCISVVPYVTNDNISSAEASAGRKLKMNKTKANIIKGEKLQLTLLGSTGKVKWTSSKKSVATVNAKGMVTAKNKGTTIITATLNKEKYKCKLIVETPKFNKKKIELKVGDTYTLKLSGTKRSATWKSSDMSVATVSNGRVVVKGAGTTMISANINEKIYKCKIIVRKPKLNAYNISLYKGETYQLKVTESKGKISWSADDTSIVKVNSNGFVSARNAGITFVKAKIGNVTVKCKITVKSPLDAIYFEQNEMNLKADESKNLKVNLLPLTHSDKLNVEYSVTDPSVLKIAKINNDTVSVTGLKEGSSIVTASCNGISSQCKITVTKADIKILHREQDITDQQFEIGESVYLDLSINSSNVTNKTVVWKSENTKVADFMPNSSMLVPLAAGTTMITADVEGKTVSAKITVNMPIDFTYSVNDRGIELSIKNRGKYHVYMSNCVTINQQYGYDLFRGFSLHTSSERIYNGSSFVYVKVYTFYEETNITVLSGNTKNMHYSMKQKYDELPVDKNQLHNLEIYFSYGNAEYKAYVNSEKELVYEIIKSTSLW